MKVVKPLKNSRHVSFAVIVQAGGMVNKEKANVFGLHWTQHRAILGPLLPGDHFKVIVKRSN
jgi:hypothetical protein